MIVAVRVLLKARIWNADFEDTQEIPPYDDDWRNTIFISIFFQFNLVISLINNRNLSFQIHVRKLVKELIIFKTSRSHGPFPWAVVAAAGG